MEPFYPRSGCDGRRIWWLQRIPWQLLEPNLPLDEPLASALGSTGFIGHFGIAFRSIRYQGTRVIMEALRLYRALMKVVRQYEVPHIRKRMM